MLNIFCLNSLNTSKNNGFTPLEKGRPKRTEASASRGRSLTGFTLIELLIVIGIAGLLLAAAVSSFGVFKKNEIVTYAAHQAVSLLEEARALTLSAKDDAEYGVDIEDGSLTMHRNGGADVKTIELDSPAFISNISLSGGGSNILFSKLTGEASRTGTVTVSSADDPAKNIVITIHGSGLIEVD